MKVLFIYQDQTMPSSRIRILNLLPELEKEGIRPEAVEYPAGIRGKFRLLKQLKYFDVVCLQKKLISPLETLGFRLFAKRFVFDFDDAIYCRDDTHGTRESRSRYLKFKCLLRRVDLAVAGNRILSDYAQQFNVNVIVVPSSVETRDIPLKKHGTINGRVIIGWVGGKGNLHHLEMLSPVLQRLAKLHDIQVNILSNSSIVIPSVQVHFIPWSLERQNEEISRFDIGLMPLPDNEWTRGKCGYKALQYMAAAVPPVVSDVGVNRDIVEHGKSGLVASMQDEFYEAIKTLIEDAGMRRELGLNARKRVEQFYSVEVVGRELARVLKAVTG